VITTEFDYQRASTVDEALALLAASDGGKLLAGGHSLVPLMKLRLSEPTVLIDIARIPGLAGIRDDNGTIEIGSGTTHRDVANSPLLAKVCPMLSETAIEIGDPQVRNRGTLGGSLAHADPAADYPAAMVALGADIVMKSARGERSVKAEDFFQGFFSVDLAPDEIITAVRFRPAASAAYVKLHQRASHFAIVGVATVVEASGGAIRSAQVGVTGAGTHATRLAAVEQALIGKPATADTARAAASLATLNDMNEDLHASAEYRAAMIPVIARRSIERAFGRL
jgi:carbon-monoxide dehydrogenase medium subunit